MHFICVHGVAHGGWCWELTREDLERHGHSVSTPDLPLTSLEDDANAVVEVLNSIDGPSVLVGHSYGGLVISKAANERTDVAHLVYVAAAMIGKDEIFLETSAEYPSDLVEHMVISEDGTSITISADGAPAVFYNRCDPTTAAKATSLLRPTAMACVATPTGAEPWKNTSSTYIVCQQDKAIVSALQQKMSKHAANVVVFDTDHSPFYSSREELEAALLKVC